MKAYVSIAYDGNCREAVKFYTKVFGAEVIEIKTYKDLHLNPADHCPYPTMKEAKNELQISSALIKIGNLKLQLVDFVDFDNSSSEIFSINIGDSKENIKKYYKLLCESGEVCVPIQKMCFSSCHAMVKDKFGIIWTLNEISAMPDLM